MSYIRTVSITTDRRLVCVKHLARQVRGSVVLSPVWSSDQTTKSQALNNDKLPSDEELTR